MSSATASAAGLAEELGLTDEDLREALLAVPREVFAPDTGLAAPASGAAYPVDRHGRPEEWRRAVFSDTAIITQWDDEHTDPGAVDHRRAVATSSLSAPGVAFDFLRLLAPRRNDRVLEIGTGTGYTAALLSACAGERNITSIEVDPAVAKQARANLKRAGFAPHLVVGEGAEGCPQAAPYDRVHATCAVRNIPPASWIAQTRPGGVIVAPWQPGHDWGWMLRLLVSGTAAHGRFHGRSGYMMLREQRLEMRFTAYGEQEAATTTTLLDPRRVAAQDEGAELALTALAPGVKLIPWHTSDGGAALALYELDAPEGSWAKCEYVPGRDHYPVTQHGPRRLWDEVEHAYLRWLDLAGPGRERFGLTVTTGGQHTIWIDTPDKSLKAAPQAD